MILPFNLKPALSTYLYLAFPFGILQRNRVPDAMLNWNIQLACQNGHTQLGVHKLSVFPALNFTAYNRLGLFQREVHVSGRIAARAIPGLTTEMMRLIDTGNYLQVYADYYYLRGTPRYNRKHFRHELLIYGYDLAQSYFLGALYTGFGSFGGIEIPFPAMLEAFLSPHGRDEPLSAYCRGDLLACYKPRLRVASARSLDLQAIHSQINWFLDEASMHDDFRESSRAQNGRPDSRKKSYGRKVYGILATYFEEIQKAGNDRLDLRVTRLLWEHKKLMGLRMRRIIDCGLADLRELLAPWQEVEAMAHAIHLRVFAGRNQRDLSYLTGLRRALMNLEMQEADLLARLLKIKAS